MCGRLSPLRGSDWARKLGLQPFTVLIGGGYRGEDLRQDAKTRRRQERQGMSLMVS